MTEKLWLVIPEQAILLDADFRAGDWDDVESAFEDVVNDKMAHAIYRLERRAQSEKEERVGNGEP